MVACWRLSDALRAFHGGVVAHIGVHCATLKESSASRADSGWLEPGDATSGSMLAKLC